eukprot:5666720-Prymnesium_polylepis.1
MRTPSTIQQPAPTGPAEMPACRPRKRFARVALRVRCAPRRCAGCGRRFSPASGHLRSTPGGRRAAARAPSGSRSTAPTSARRDRQPWSARRQCPATLSRGSGSVPQSAGRRRSTRSASS